MRKLIFFIFFIFTFSEYAKGQSMPNFWSEIQAFQIQDQKKLAPRHPILFVGSSSFTKWVDIQNYFPEYPILNRGFGGSTLLDVIRYAYDVIIKYNPKQVIIYCGENDFAYVDSVSSEQVFLRFKTLFGMIRTNFPSISIDYISIKPSPARSQLKVKFEEANRLIENFLKSQKKAAFVNVYSSMMNKQGKIRTELFSPDKLHMNPEGYALWKKIILPYLAN